MINKLRVNNTKYLGVYLDENLKWDNHIDNLCTKESRSISGLKQARNYASLDILKVIYNALIQPVFDYCDIVWRNLDKGLSSTENPEIAESCGPHCDFPRL